LGAKDTKMVCARSLHASSVARARISEAADWATGLGGISVASAACPRTSVCGGSGH